MILQGLYALMIVILFWIFPPMVVKEYLPKLSGTCPNFVTVLFNAFKMIVVVPPGLSLDCHGISV